MTNRSAKLIVSGDIALLARRYAGAFFELAEENKALESAADDMRALADICANNHEFFLVAHNPRLTRAQLVHAATAMADSMKLNKLTAKFIALVAQNRRLAMLDAIAQAFLKLLADTRNEFEATVRTAAALSPQQAEQLSARLAGLAGGKVHLNVQEDKSLIGGLTVQMGSRLIDLSIRSKLQRLERQLKTQAA